MKRHSCLPRWSWGILFLPFTYAGCATQSKEPGRAVSAPSTAEAPKASTAPAEMKTQQPSVEAADSAEDESFAGSPVAPAQAPTPAAAAAPPAPKAANKPASRADAARSGGAVSASGTARKSKSAPASLGQHEQDAAPAFAEPPELRAALLEFDAQWEQLSTSKACEDACRAHESMRRSAQRICDLVMASDPRDRCRVARGRLDQATRDLASRCADCR